MWLQIMWLLIFTLWHNQKIIRVYETQAHTFTLKANRMWNVKRKNIHIHLFWHSFNEAYYFLIILTFTFVFVFCLNLFFYYYFFYFVLLFLCFNQVADLVMDTLLTLILILLYFFLLIIFITYLFITATYCQLISIY